MTKSHLESDFLFLIRCANFPKPEQEYRFDQTRRFRFDFAWPELKLAVEIEGGIWLGRRGGHTSAKGYINNCRKYNLAVLQGWTVLRYTKETMREGIEDLEGVFRR